jgi:MtrB/PioB family decaheme-associated outer membrane protein
MRSPNGIQLLFGAALLVQAIPAVAAEPELEPEPPDTSEWTCDSCPFDKGTRIESEAGGAYVSDDAARAGDGIGYQESGGFLIANVDGKHIGEEGRHFEYEVDQAGLESREASVSGGQYGHYDWRVSYEELPHFIYDTTETVFTGVRSAELGLPAGWVRGGTTASMTTLATDLREVDIENKRKTLGLGGEYRFGKNFSLSASYSREERDGLKVHGGAFGVTASQLPLDLAATTDQAQIALRYRLPRGDLTLAWYGSFFDSDDTARIWSNPFPAWTPGADLGQMAAPPDNDFQQLVFSGGFSFPLNTHLNFSASTGKMSQDDDLLPYTVNPLLVTTPLPRARLGGEVSTTDLQISVTSRPSSLVRGRISYHYDDRDNDTPVESWSIVEGDGLPSGTWQNTPYGFTRERLSLGGEINWPASVRLSGGYDRVEMQRPLQEVEEQVDETGWGQLTWDPAAWVSLSFRGGATAREIGSYGTLANDSFAPQNPLLRKYNLADRDRQFGEFRASFNFGEDSKYTIEATAAGAEDDYKASRVGLTDASERNAALDFNWAVNEKVSLFLRGGFDQIKSDQAGSASFGAADWFAHNTDDFTSVGTGVRWLGIGEKVDLTFDYTYGRGTGDIHLDSAGQPRDEFPDILTRLNTVRLNATYRVNPKLEIIGDLRYEDSEANDWALDGVGPATMPNVLSLGAEAYDYDVFVVGLSFRYFFGERDVVLPEEEEEAE